MFFYSLLLDGKVYLIPVDVGESYSKVIFKQNLLSLETIVSILLEHREVKELPIIVILDCCRSESNTVGNYDEGDSLLASGEIGRQANIAILYSTAGGQVAMDDGPDDSDN